jgi:hypothetical protein
MSSIEEALEDMLQSLRPFSGARGDASVAALLEGLPPSRLTYDLEAAADRQKVFIIKFCCRIIGIRDSSRQQSQGVRMLLAQRMHAVAIHTQPLMPSRAEHTGSTSL